MARKDLKKRLIKKAIRHIAEKRGWSNKSYWKVTNYEIHEYMKDNGHDYMLSQAAIWWLRRTLPKMYREKDIK